MRLLLCFAILLGCTEKRKPEKAPPHPPAEEQPKQKSALKSDDVAAEKGDLDAIQKRGTLRILIYGTGEDSFLPRNGMPALQDIQMAERFAERLGVKPELVLVEEYDQLIPMLEAGKGDLIAAQFTVTEARKEKVTFGRSKAAISELLIGKKGAPDLPKKKEELAGREVHVRKSSSYWETLGGLEGVKRVAVPEHLDAESIVYEVTTGKRPLTVVDSHILDVVETYNDGVARLFPLAAGQELAWAMRKESPKLKAAVDEFVIEQAMRKKEELSVDDLAAIKKRGVLRVLTRNNPITYFLQKGRQFGWDYELSKLIADEMGVRLEMVVPPSRRDLIPWLLEGRGDMIAASMTVTEGRMKKVAFSAPYQYVDEVVVKKKGAEGPASIGELDGKKVHVRRFSSYYATLKKAGVEPVLAPSDQETEELIAKVASGEIELTVADTHILELELSYGTEVEKAFHLTELPPPKEGEKRGKRAPTAAKSIAFAVRPTNPELLKFLSSWVKKNYRGLDYNILKKRYFENRRNFAKAKEQRLGKTGQISPYDPIIEQFSKKYGLDWRLMAAQAYVESRFDPKAKSWVGAKGLFQVMPRTGKALGFSNLEDPKVGTHAGIKYMNRLIGHFDPELPFSERMFFALASYNAGYGHVLDARRLAEAEGLDASRWFGNVEKAMLLLSQPQHARRARHGYCRGKEPVAYVRHIDELYQAYVKVAPK